MAVPIAARDVAAVVGALLVLTAAVSVVGTLIVPRSVASWLTRWVGVIVNGAFNLITSPIASYKQRDRILAAEAATFLISQLVAWLIISFIGYTLLVWPFTSGGITSAVTLAGPAVFGPNDALGAAERIIADLAAGTALIIVTLQIAYLPTLYSAFNRREDDVSLLNARAGVPSWGPELLARTHYALGSGASTIDTLPDLYEHWEGWASDLAESHTTYLPLVWFRSPAAVILGDLAAGGAGFSRAVPFPVAAIGAGGPGPAVLAFRVRMPDGDSAGDGIRHTRRA